MKNIYVLFIALVLIGCDKPKTQAEIYDDYFKQCMEVWTKHQIDVGLDPNNEFNRQSIREECSDKALRIATDK